jgi:hypothetical protein
VAAEVNREEACRSTAAIMVAAHWE